VGSYFGEEILLAKSLLKWYLEKGLQVTQAYQCIQFTPAHCFETFTQEVTQCRQKEDGSPGDHTILADTMKLREDDHQQG